MEHIDETRYDTDAVKYRLIEYRERAKDIESQTERLDRLEMKILSIGSPTLSDMPKSPSPPQDRTTALIADKIDLENDIRQAIAEQRREKEAIEIILRKLRHSEERAVIRMRYFDGASWNDVVDMLFGCDVYSIKQIQPHRDRGYSHRKDNKYPLAQTGGYLL